jgi:hypothetical protein
MPVMHNSISIVDVTMTLGVLYAAKDCSRTDKTMILLGFIFTF